HVEVSFDEDRAVAAADGLPRLIDAEQRLTLSVDRRLGRVDVLRRLLGVRPRRLEAEGRELRGVRIVEGATAERDHAPLRIEHGEHQPMPEAIVVAGARALGDDEPRTLRGPEARS